MAFDFSQECLAEDALHNGAIPAVEGVTTFSGPQFALLELETPVLCLPSAMLIASRLDSDIHVNTVRTSLTYHTPFDDIFLVPVKELVGPHFI